MKLEVRDRPYDLYAVIGASLVLVLIILIFPKLDVIRIILGLPFILFFPGYVLICALYPERKRYFDMDGKEVPPPSDKDEEEQEEEEKGDESGAVPGTRRKDRGRARDGKIVVKDNGDDGSEWPKGKGLDGLERIALSLGLSIAITPLIGLVLNYTYDWAPDTLGIRLVPILVSQFAFILIVGGLAIYKRVRVPREERFAIVIDLKFPQDQTLTDKVLTVGIIVMMVLSVGLLVYIIVVPREGESFTEFYILGPNHKAEGYPRNLLLDESSFIYIGIGNHEHKNMNYTLVMTLDPLARNDTQPSFDNVTISRNLQPAMEVIVPDEQTVELKCNFSILEPGSYKLRFLLFRDGGEYRDLHIWVRVFQDGYLKNAAEERIEFFMAGVGGDPSLLPSVVDDETPLIISIGARNMLQEDIWANITFSIDDANIWMPLHGAPLSGIIEPGTGTFLETAFNTTSSWGPVDVALFLPEGEWSLVVDLRTASGSTKLVHDVMVVGT
ncbi:MAG: DUF1616 domain-containing protein [Candidatus Thermoplasmatota archaeon]|nr:DUF1616 domain-containing protein [Candidatus Thermoplasmatota archaeon]